MGKNAILCEKVRFAIKIHNFEKKYTMLCNFIKISASESYLLLQEILKVI